MVLQGRGEKDDISIRKTIGEIELIVSSKDEVEIEALGCSAAEIADEASVGLMADFAAKLFIFIEDFCSNYSYIAHL